METQHTQLRRKTFFQRHPTPLWALGCSLLLSVATIGASGGVSSSSSSSSSGPRLGKTDHELTEYRALRRMHAKSDKFSQEGWLDAWTEFDGTSFRYRVMSERGSDYVRNKVLKAVLRREQELIAEGLAGRAALTEENYEFADEETDGSGLRYVAIKPKRKEVTLVDGRMVLSADGSDLLRVEGRLAKNPSFWTSLVNIIRHFAKIDGVRVPVATESIAKVKFAGQSRLDVYYEYESINGRPVSTAARRILAAASPGAPLPE